MLVTALLKIFNKLIATDPASATGRFVGKCEKVVGGRLNELEALTIYFVIFAEGGA